MGLIEADPRHANRAMLRAWLLPGLVAVGALALELAGDAGRVWLRYERAAIADGELWRLLSGHIVHLGWSHAALNAAGLLLIAYLVGAAYTTRQWLLIALLTIAAIDAGFWLFDPRLAWYVGLSGLLHGLLAAGVVAGLLRRSPLAWLLGAVVTIKLVYEQLVGAVPGSAAASGGAVIVAAHLYGALAGAAAGFAVRVRRPASL